MTHNLTRRRFLQLGALGAVSLGYTGSALYNFCTEDLELVSLDLTIPNLTKSFHYYRIGFITDAHLGPFLPDEWLENALSMLVRQGIDLLLIGGDNLLIPTSSLSKLFWVDRNPKFNQIHPKQRARSILNTFGQIVAKYIPVDGSFAVMGNHDGWVAPKLSSKILKPFGTNFLVNSSVAINRGSDVLRISGVDDYWTGRPMVPNIPDKAPKTEVRVLLCHNPDYVYWLSQNTALQFHLSLSGHTHGGQIKLPGLGALLYNVQETSLSEGLIKLPFGWHYTSRGIGVVEIPYRINCRPEVTLITLMSA